VAAVATIRAEADDVSTGWATVAERATASNSCAEGAAVGRLLAITENQTAGVAPAAGFQVHMYTSSDS
jgi:hypothetical protein